MLCRQSRSEMQEGSGKGMASWLRNLCKDRWLGLCLGMWLQACGGISYVFSLYSADLKKVLGYSQEGIDGIGTFKDIGGNVGIISGLLIDVTSAWFVLLVGGLLHFSFFTLTSCALHMSYLCKQSPLRRIKESYGLSLTPSLSAILLSSVGEPNSIGSSWWISVAILYGAKFQRHMLYLAATGQIVPSYWQMCVIMMLGTNGSTWFNTAVLVTCVRNFSSDRGVTVGLLKGFIGLSGAIFSQVYTAIYAPHTGPFLLLCAAVPPLIAIISMAIIRPLEAPKQRNESDKSYFSSLYLIGISLALYLLTVISIQDMFIVSKNVSRFFMVVMLVILLLPGFLPWKVQMDAQLKGYSQLPTEAPPIPAPAVVNDRSSKHQGERKAAGVQHNFGRSTTIDVGAKVVDLRKDAPKTLPDTPSKKTRLGHDHTLLEAAQTRDYWLLFFAMGCGTGSGLTAINNLAQMAESAGSQSTGSLVALVSVWNFLGRLASGYVSEWYMKKYGTPRPLFLLVVQAVMGVSHLLFATAAPAMLYPASVLVGLAHGAHWTLMVATSSELFGLRNLGALYNTLSISAPLGSYFLSVKLAGYIYDRQALALSATGDNPTGLQGPHKCIGPQCFRATFLVMALICTLGCLSLLLLTNRTRKVYLDMYRQQAQLKDHHASLKALSNASPAEGSSTANKPNLADDTAAVSSPKPRPSTASEVHRLRHSTPSHIE